MGQGSKRIKLKAPHSRKRPVVRVIVNQPGYIDIREGTADGHPAALIDAPEGTKIERPKEDENADYKNHPTA